MPRKMKTIAIANSFLVVIFRYLYALIRVLNNTNSINRKVSAWIKISAVSAIDSWNIRATSTDACIRAYFIKMLNNTLQCVNIVQTPVKCILTFWPFSFPPFFCCAS